MQTRTLRYRAAFALFVALAVSGGVAQTQQKTTQPPNYYVINLGDPLGVPSAAAASINNIGWIAGDAFATASSEHAELWVGVPLDLGTLGGPNSAVGWPNKNDRGQIVGITETADMNPLGEDWSCALANFPTITNHVCYGFLWEDGVMSALPPLPGGLDSYGSGINNRGQAVGWAENGVHESTCTPPQVLQFKAVIWGPKLGEMTELPPLSGDLDGAATAINDNGQVVGISGICDQAIGRYTARHAVLWENGVPINLGNFDGGVAWNTPTAISNQGQVVGFANLPNTQPGAFNPVAFLWSKQHHMQKLRPLGEDTNSWAWGINAQGQAVGQSFGVSSARAFLYQDGVMTDLNTLVQPDSSLYLLLANDINARGEIVGYASDTKTNAIVAFLAIPVSGSTREAAQTEGYPGGNSKRSFVPDNIRRPLKGFGGFVKSK
jgi:probable HAF family extracellular repeat protein